MSTRDEGLLTAVRAETGTAHGWNGDWLALFAADGFSTGTFNERMLAWINDYLGTSYANLPDAQNAFAVDQGFTNWNSMDTFDLGTFAEDLLGDETQGLALDFTDSAFASTGQYGSAFVLDTSTPANNYDSHPYGLLTYTSPSVKMTLGPSGTYRYGAHNLILQSQTFGTTWTLTNVTVANNTEIRETAVTSTHRLRQSVSSVVAGQTYVAAFRVTGVGRTRVTINVGNSSVSNGLTARFDLAGVQLVAAVATFGTGYSTTGAVASIASVGDGSIDVQLQFVAVDTTTGVELQLDAGAGLAGSFTSYAGDTNSGVNIARSFFRVANADTTYLATTSAARYALPFEWSTTGALQGILVEESRTNSITWSNDLTNAAWLKNANITTALNVTGPDGVANSATRLTASAADAIVYFPITAASAARSSQAMLQRITGTGTISITQGQGDGSELVTNGTFDTNTTGWTPQGNAVLASTSGELQITTGTTGVWAEQTITCVVGRLYRATATIRIGTNTSCIFRVGTSQFGSQLVNLSTASASNTTVSGVFVATQTNIFVSLGGGSGVGVTNFVDNVTVQEVAWTSVTPSTSWVATSHAIENQTLTNPIFGIRIHTSGDVIAAWGCTNEAGAFKTSIIETFGATATRAADILSLNTTAFPLGSANTLYVKGTRLHGDSSRYTVTLSDGTINELIGLYSSSATGVGLLVIDGGVTQASITSGTIGIGAAFKQAAAIDTNDVAHSLNGAAVGTDATATMPTVTALRINSTGAGGSGTWRIEQAMVLPRRMANADLQTLATP